MIVSFLSQKGGVGKSTLARNLAVAAARLGWKVTIADMDPFQGTALAWNGRRLALPGERPHVDVVRYNSRWNLRAAERSNDLVVVDGPAHANRDLIPVAKTSALVVLPIAMKADDVEPQLTLANELLDAGVPHDRMALCFCRVRASDARRRRAREWLAEAAVQPLLAELREMPAIDLAQDVGLAACEANPASVRAEAEAVATEMLEHLGEPAL